ncbi:MAG TPA: creatininase family protein [Mycobacteriales bacterium]|jgi:creatinine amidohydrolase|nr:creatininase family protein [Mycobacteriales bacterium]
MEFVAAATSGEVGRRAAGVAVLPIGSFEQHGSFLPLGTDTVVASAIAGRISAENDLFLLPPVTISCSHEHSAFPGTVSISAGTLAAVVRDIAASLDRSGVTKLVLVNGHGGNYVLSNVAQEANVGARRMLLFPGRADWDAARAAGGLVTSTSADMHAGELEVSILLAVRPDLVGAAYADPASDTDAPDRPDLLMLGMQAYTRNGVIGRPSLGTAAKGHAVLDSLSRSFRPHVVLLA